MSKMFNSVSMSLCLNKRDEASVEAVVSACMHAHIHGHARIHTVVSARAVCKGLPEVAKLEEE